MCEVANCTEENCIHKRCKELKEQVMKKLDVAEKHRYKWKDQKPSHQNGFNQIPAKTAQSNRG